LAGDYDERRNDETLPSKEIAMIRALCSASLVSFLFAAAAAAGQKDGAKIEKIGEGVLKAPLSIRTTPTGALVVLDRRGDDYAVVRFSPSGELESQTPVPASIKGPTLALVDHTGTMFFLRQRDHTLWVVEPGEKPFPVEMKGPILGAALRRVKTLESLYLLGERKSGVLRLAGGRVVPIVLSKYPATGELIELRVRGNGHLYAYATAEHLVYHFDSRGKFLEAFGGGGPAPPRVGIPADYLMQTYDVDRGGDIYWTLANYGPLLRLSSDGTSGVHFRGTETWSKPWMGPIHTVTGLALSGDRAYAIDRGYNRITSFPKALVADGADGADTVDTRVFGYSFRLLSDAPYKLFTGAEARLRIAFAPGHRLLHKVTLAYQLSDIAHRRVAHGSVELDVPGDGAVERDLPLLNLPRLGWYQLDTTLMDGDSVLGERVAFLGRTNDDPRTPIPPKEQSGWNDLATHRMIGMGLHRFGGSMKQILEEQRPFIEEARRLGIPHFVQITEERDCTPANVAAILKQYPELPLLEIVNEPNLRMKVEAYVKLLRPCYEAAKAVSAKARVMGPAQCGSELGWFEAFLKSGGGAYVDVVSVHTYERHNSMDPYHWGWKLPKLRELMDRHGLKEKPLYQTEHGFMADYHAFLARPLWQGRAVFLETFLMDRNRIGPERYYYYYVNQGGFRGFSAYLVTAERELFPAASLLRSRAQLLGDRTFAEALDFGAPGNWLVLGNRYTGPRGDMVVLVNCGAWKPLSLDVKLPPGARVVDSFGNPAELAQPSRLEVGRLPIYVELPPGTRLEASLPAFGHNVAPTAKVIVEDEAAQKSSVRLTNGRLEFDFENEPDRIGMLATKDKLPLDVTLEFDKAHTLSSAILYGSLADNDKCTPLEYDLSVRCHGTWRKLDSVRVAAEGRTLKYGNFARLTGYDNPWIFVHRFASVEADAVKFHFVRTTFGQYPTEQLNAEIARSGLRPRVELREIQVFADR
jgi:hypothetical protein